MFVQKSGTDGAVSIVISDETAVLLTSALGSITDRTQTQGLFNLFDALVTAGVKDLNDDKGERYLFVEENEFYDPEFPGDRAEFIVAE